jgi:nucleotide-binding universal stress UspA family protein
MQLFRTILVAADFSENSVAAFHVACSLNIDTTTRLIVLHVVEPDWVAKTPDYLGQGVVPASTTESLHEFLERRMGEVYVPNHPLEVEYRTSEGSAAAEIVRMADSIGADLIVMGTHGRSGLRRLLAGSVAATVLIKAHCSVLALRAGPGAPKTDGIKVILHPTDFSKASEPALGVARSLARDHGARLIVLHVAPVDIYLEGRLAAEFDPADFQRSLDAIRQRLDGPDLKYPVETRLTRSYAAEGILGTAEDLACDLIVMGTHGRTGLGRLLMGNTAESVLPKADCPVLVVKPFWGETVCTSGRAAAGAETPVSPESRSVSSRSARSPA